MKRLALVIVSLLAAQPVFAGAAEPSELPEVARPANSHSWIKDLRLGGGFQLLQVGPTTDSAPGVSVVYQHPRSPWSVEIGAMLPHDAPAGLQRVEQTQPLDSVLGLPLNNGSGAIEARIAKFWEAHLAGSYRLPHGRQSWVVPDLGLGISLLELTNQIHTNVTGTVSSGPFAGLAFAGGFDNSEVVYSLSPTARAGLTFFEAAPLNLRADASYAAYANTFKSGDQLYDLGFSGWMVRVLLQLRL
jgi:hypothetical protein